MADTYTDDDNKYDGNDLVLHVLTPWELPPFKPLVFGKLGSVSMKEFTKKHGKSSLTQARVHVDIKKRLSRKRKPVWKLTRTCIRDGDQLIRFLRSWDKEKVNATVESLNRHYTLFLYSAQPVEFTKLKPLTKYT